MNEKTHGKATEIGGDSPTNGGASVIDFSKPYIARATIRGSSDILLHRWNPDAVEAKAAAAKGSKAKKTDDIESYVYRDDNGELAVPGEYVRQSIIHAAKYRQDPRSPRKSAMDLYKAGVVSLTPLASFGKAIWEYEDRRRVVVGRAGVNRTRPALKAGWGLTVDFLVNLPEYIPTNDLLEVLSSAGRLIGFADFRPTFGRYNVVSWDVLEV